MTTILDNRAKAVEDEQTCTAQAKEQAEKLLSQYNDQLSKASQESRELLAQSQAKAQLEYDAAMNKAETDSKALMESTCQQLAVEREKMLQGVRKEVAQLAVMAASKVAQQSLDTETDRSLAEQFLAEAGERK